MFKQALPGIVAFVLLVAVAAGSIVGFRLYQVSEAATILLTGQCSTISADALTAVERKITAKVEREVTTRLEKELAVKEKE